MVTPCIDTSAPQVTSFSTTTSLPAQAGVAARLSPGERQDLSVQVLARTQTVTELASQNAVSRKFLYRQANKASDALEEAFAPPPKDDRVLFRLPVTKAWIRQFVLAQVLIGHSSFRGVIELLRDLFRYDISLGTIHNIIQEAIPKARKINQAQDLSGVRVGAHDEIFQAGKPVLVGADIPSTYCYLLTPEEHRDEITWGVRLLELAEQGLHPDYTIADGGQGLRAGQTAAWTDVPCHGDIFHAELDFGKLAYYLENRASGCTTTREKLERKVERAKRGNRKTASVAQKLRHARTAEAQAITLARDIRALADWMKNDVLSLAGPDMTTRRELFDFIVEELRQRESLAPHRIRPVRTMLENQGDHLLAFAAVLDQKFVYIAARFNVSPSFVHAICELQGLDKSETAYWRREASLHRKLRGTFHDIEKAVLEAMADTPRASSIIENLNSRLRNYFFLRRHIGNDYLELLQFFLNHRRFLRSERPERLGKSPAELLAGEAHPHWLELLSFERFRLN